MTDFVKSLTSRIKGRLEFLQMEKRAATEMDFTQLVESWLVETLPLLGITFENLPPCRGYEEVIVVRQFERDMQGAVKEIGRYRGKVEMTESIYPKFPGSFCVSPLIEKQTYYSITFRGVELAVRRQQNSLVWELTLPGDNVLQARGQLFLSRLPIHADLDGLRQFPPPG